jgi:O-acetyl-ADP-ribose deacetylase (regulator of RNase III)
MLKHETEECTKLPVEVQMKHFQEKMTKSLDDIRTQHEAEILALKSKITQQDQLILELKANIEASAKAGSLSECITYSGLKRSPLELMPKLLSGCIPGVHYYASRGRVEIYGCCEDEVVARGYCFQLEYQKVVLACRFKTVKLKPFTNSDDLGSFLIELNRKYDSSYLFRTKLDGADVVKIVSTDVSQCDDAVKVLTAKMDSFQCYKMNIGNGRKIVLKMGDICQEDVDVICTTANKHLDVSSKAVGYALNQATRGDLQKICNNYISVNGTLEMGDVAVTSSGGGLLKAKHIIHIVNPTAPRNAEALLSQGVTNAIAAAIKLKATSIAIPALSAGSMLTNDDGLCSMVIKTISEYPYPSECKSLKDIRIIVIGAKVFASFVKCFN